MRRYGIEYVPDRYIKITFNDKTHLLGVEGTQEALVKMFNAHPHLRACIAKIEFLDKPAWKRVA